MEELLKFVSESTGKQGSIWLILIGVIGYIVKDVWKWFTGDFAKKLEEDREYKASIKNSLTEIKEKQDAIVRFSEVITNKLLEKI